MKLWTEWTKIEQTGFRNAPKISGANGLTSAYNVHAAISQISGKLDGINASLRAITEALGSIKSSLISTQIS